MMGPSLELEYFSFLSVEGGLRFLQGEVHSAWVT